MKKMVILMMLLLLCGCQTNLKSDEEYLRDTINSFISGQQDKNIDDAMTVDEAKAIVADFSILYDRIDYYGIVKYKLGDIVNNYYAFLVENDDVSLYLLIDMYDGIIFYVTPKELGIEN